MFMRIGSVVTAHEVMAREHCMLLQVLGPALANNFEFNPAILLRASWEAAGGSQFGQQNAALDGPLA